MLILLLVFSLSEQLFAQQQDPNKQKDLFDMSIEELMDVPIFATASRLPTKLSESSAPVSVITAEDIHYSGLTSIAEILQFTPGVDLLKIDRRRYAVGIHGLHETLSDRTTLLVNGRAADNPIYGGPDFWGLPVLVEDIARIEVVRSPGSASWGANALTGVINIVTKKPEEMLGGFAKTTISEFGDSYTHLRCADKQGKWSWRASAGYEDIVSSEDAIGSAATYRSFMPALNPLIDFDSFEVRDFDRSRRFDTEAFYNISEKTQMSFGLGHSHVEAGDYESGGYYPMKNMREDDVRSYAKLDREFEDGGRGYLQWSGKFWNANWPNMGLFRTAQNEFEGQLNLPQAEAHQTSIGASFTWDHINVTKDSEQQTWISGNPLDEYNAGLFLIDQWRATQRLMLEGQIRSDWYSETQVDWSGRLSAIYGLDDEKNHILRVSTAKAFRAPLVALRETSINLVPIGFGLYLLNVTAPRKLDNEETYSVEAGYTGKLSKHLTVRTDVYYQRFSKLLGYRKTSNMLGQMFATIDNLDGADSWGSEFELILEGKAGKLSVWYAYNEFDADQENQDVSAFLPARHKAGVSGRLFLREGWVFNTNYMFRNTTRGNPCVGNNDVGSSNRLDVTISKEIAGGKGELMIGVSDLLENMHDAIRESIEYTGHKIPGRTFFASFMFRF